MIFQSLLYLSEWSLNQNPSYTYFLEKDKLMILDSVGLFSQSEIDRLLTKHNLKVLGRGDI